MAYPSWLVGCWYFHSSRIRHLIQARLYTTIEHSSTDIDSAVAAMHSLRRDGIQFAADDFGTGYSSLSYLQKLPLDALKVDRSFIVQIDTDQVTRELTRNIVAIAHTLDLRVIAEGIETHDQHQVIEALNCHYGQGFLYGHPQSAEAIETGFLNNPHEASDLH